MVPIHMDSNIKHVIVALYLSGCSLNSVKRFLYETFAAQGGGGMGRIEFIGISNHEKNGNMGKR